MQHPRPQDEAFDRVGISDFTSFSAGHDVRTVAGRLGHANPAMTLRTYAHVVESADRAVAATLGELLDTDS